ncbi:MAG: hypothetical protein CMJ13_07750 [Pelagibacterales bacterium]|nr:hypothetical protein [Pelagibacterales bacterium]|tara:strand:- start:1849 stop:2466 length:618 start_codon:yes stop_codon:yes gene_type:complete
MKINQHLYLVFGGYLKRIGIDNFSNIKSLEYVGIYDSLSEAKKVWKSKSIKNIDYANKKFKVIPLFNLFDPSEKIFDYLKKLENLKIKVDSLTFDLDDDLFNIVKKLKKQNAGAGVVINKKKLRGIVTERDIIRVISKKKNKAFETKVKNFMTKKVIYININDTLINALEILKSSGFRHLPIYDDKNIKYYGILSYKDFLLGNIY